MFLHTSEVQKWCLAKVHYIKLIAYKIAKIGVKHHQLSAKTTNTVQQTERNIRRQCQLVLDLLGGTCKMCKLLSFFIFRAIHRVPLVAGTSLLWRGSLSRDGRGCFVCVFLLLLRFLVPAASAILNRTIRICLAVSLGLKNGEKVLGSFCK